jgi:hypothetical protein
MISRSIYPNNVRRSRGKETSWEVEPESFDSAMQQGVRGHPIVICTALGNKRISRKRSYVEHPFTVLNMRSLLLLPL